MHLDLLTALVTGLFMLLAGPVTAMYMARRATRQEGAAVRAAILAEVASLSRLIDARGYCADFLLCAEKELGITIDVPDSFFAVYRTHLSKLGLLDAPTASRIVTFYQLLDAVVQDVKPGGVANTDPYRELLEQDAAMLEQAQAIARELIGT